MLRAALLATIATAALAGCTPAGPPPAKPTPGQWELKQSASDLDKPDVPARTATKTACLKAVDLDFTKLSDQVDQYCKASDVVHDPGKIHASVSCLAGQPNASEAVVDGTSTANTLHVEITTTQQDGGLTRRVKMVMDGRRIGECPAGQ